MLRRSLIACEDSPDRRENARSAAAMSDLSDSSLSVVSSRRSTSYMTRSKQSLLNPSVTFVFRSHVLNCCMTLFCLLATFLIKGASPGDCLASSLAVARYMSIGVFRLERRPFSAFVSCATVRTLFAGPEYACSAKYLAICPSR